MSIKRLLFVLPFLMPIRAGAETIAPAARAYAIAEIHSAVNVYFSHWIGTDRAAVDAAFKRWVRESFESDDRRAFDLATMRFFATLKNGHTSFGDRWLTKTYGQDLGFYARLLDGRWTVIESAAAGLKPGDVLQTIDGRPIADFVTDERQYLAGSSQRQQLLDAFRRPYLFPQSFALGTASGTTVRIARTVPAAQTFADTESAMLSQGVGYVKIHSFLQERFEKEAEDAVRRFKHARTLIVDVRGNGGGVTPDDLTRLLMDKAFVGLSESSKIGVALYEADAAFISGSPNPSLDLAPPMAGGTLSWSNPVEQPSSDAFKGKLIVLADGGCASACDDFVSVFKIAKRATIVGETTYGSTGQPYFESLPDGMGFRVSAKRDTFPDGSPFEGVGVAPDVPLAPTSETLLAGRDPVLEKAIELAK